MPLVSGAGHDAIYLKDVTDTGMIFVPSVDGISHNEDEFTSWEDCVAGANVFVNATYRLATQSDAWAAPRGVSVALPPPSARVRTPTRVQCRGRRPQQQTAPTRGSPDCTTGLPRPRSNTRKVSNVRQLARLIYRQSAAGSSTRLPSRYASAGVNNPISVFRVIPSPAIARTSNPAASRNDSSRSLRSSI